MAYKAKTFTRGREWLNALGHDDTGAISWYVTATSYSADATVEIRDCSRQIALDFSVYNKQSLAARKRKLQRVIHAFEQVLENLDAAHEYHLEVKKELPKTKRNPQTVSFLDL